MGLPAELRIAIFEYALADEHVSIRHRRSSSCEDLPIRWNGTALLAINSQMRHETYPVFLDNTTFEFYDGFDEQDLRRWTKTIGYENLHKVQAIVFHCMGRCSMYGLQPEYAFCSLSEKVELTSIGLQY